MRRLDYSYITPRKRVPDKDYWCTGKDGAGHDFGVTLKAPDDTAMWEELDRHFGGPVSRDGLTIAEVEFNPFRTVRVVFGFNGKEAAE